VALAGCSLWLLPAACVQDIRLYSDAGRPASDAAQDGSIAPQPVCRRLDAEPPPLIAALQGDGCAPLAARVFGHALCACDALSMTGPLTTGAFDSALGPFVTAQVGAAVGCNGSLSVKNGFELMGALTVGGASLASWSSGTFHASGDVQIDRDLVLDQADAQLDAALSVSRNIALNGSSLRAASGVYFGGLVLGASSMPFTSEQRELRVEPPCPCPLGFAAELVQLRQRFARDNDNAAHGVQAGALGGSGLELACARFLVDGGTLATARWSVSGVSALFIDGDLEIAERLEVVLAERAELDVFVHGELRLGPAARVETTRPGALRFYVSGRAGILLEQGARFAGNLFAPDEVLTLPHGQTIEGALAVGTLIASDGLDVRYDGSVLRSVATIGRCGP
jgi:hypothetical protein